MKKIIVPILVLSLVTFALLGAWAKYNYVRNLETAAEKQTDIIGLEKNSVLAKFGRPAGWGVLAEDSGGLKRKEVLLYTTWNKDIVITLLDDKVTSVKVHDIQRSVWKQVLMYLDPRFWLSSVTRLVTVEA